MHLIAKSAIVDAFDVQKLTFKFVAINEKLATEAMEYGLIDKVMERK